MWLICISTPPYVCVHIMNFAALLINEKLWSQAGFILAVIKLI